MAIATKRTIMGAHVWLARHAAGTSDASNKPNGNDSAWIPLGLSEDGIEVQIEEEEVEIYDPQPTVLALTEVLTTKRDLRINGTINQFSALAVQLLFGTQTLTSSSSQFNPLAGNAVGVLGWIKLQGYDKSNGLAIVTDHWCRLKLTSPVRISSREVFATQIEARELHSLLNTGLGN